MTLEKAGLTIVRVIDRATDCAAGILLFLILAFGCYSLWDSQQVYQAAEAWNYTAYKPAPDDTRSFSELQEINPDVFAWLTVNDTPIDYPVVQTGDNFTYINTNAEGEYTLSGAIFLDYRNSPCFDDFNSIIYGHHMEQRLMFGALSDFAEKSFFDDHPYGNLFFGGEDHGIEFFALVLTDAYDERFFTPAVEGQEEREMLLETVRQEAVQIRDLPVTADDQVIVLSTCTSSITNGRYLLFGRLSSRTYPVEKPVTAAPVRRGGGTDRFAQTLTRVPLWLWIALFAMLCTAAGLLEWKIAKGSSVIRSKGRKYEEDETDSGLVPCGDRGTDAADDASHEDGVRG
ncbi:MAG: class B sortase [Lachnospiraceae bacterium]|nr:class B sortase [Lachnospiraceae bacterium]